MSEEYLEQKQIKIEKCIRRYDLKKIFSVFSDVKKTVADKKIF